MKKNKSAEEAIGSLENLNREMDEYLADFDKRLQVADQDLVEKVLAADKKILDACKK